MEHARPGRRGDTARGPLLVVAAISITFLALLQFDLGGEEVARRAVNVAFTVVAGAITLLMAGAARRCEGPGRRAWALLAASMGLWCASQVLWTYHEEVQGQTAPFPSLADVGFVLSLPLAAIGVLSFSVGAGNVAARLRRLTDGLIAATGTFVGAWLLLMDQAAARDTSDVERALALAYPIGCGVVASVVLMMFGSIGPGRRMVFRLLTLGQVVIALCTAVFTWGQLDGTYRTGGPLDALWLTGLCLMGAAAHLCGGDEDVRVRADAAAPSVRGTLLVYSPVAVAVVIGALTGRLTGEVGPELILPTVFLVGLLAARQVLTITENVGLAEAIKSTDRHYEALVRNSSDLVLVTNGRARLTYVSPSVERILGYRVEDVAGATLASLVHPDDHHLLRGANLDVFKTGSGHTELRVRDAHSGDWRWIDAMAADLLSDPSIRGVVINARDTTDRHLAEEALSHQAVHDSLTGLPNRSVVLDRLGALEVGEEVAVLFCDLDGFKHINDSLGHDRGDEVLREVASRLLEVLGPNETVARFGGDEFVVLCEGIGDEAGAQAVAARVAGGLRAALSVAGVEMGVTFSIGVRLAVGPCDPATMVADADAAMYEAKSRGRGLVEIFDERLRLVAEQRLQLEQSINDVLAHGPVVLHYQPLWRMTEDGPQLRGAEALLRWRAPDGTLVGPVDVIAVAEETGLIIPLGARILETACLELARWHAAGRDLALSVNLSARQLGDPGLVDEVVAALAASGAPAASLMLEVTETALMEDPRGALETLHRLRDLGVGLAIDDYGTGYCSLSYLSAFPVQLLKVDGAFVAQMTTNAQDRTIVASVIGLAHALGIAALGEGVETDQQLEMLAEMGCDHVQGYLLGRPQPGSQLVPVVGPVDAEPWPPGDERLQRAEVPACH